ncbi:DUF1569 domain-containing protein [soil metagenome]
MATRRTLAAFDSFSSAVADAQTLLHNGYERAGVWSLGQCCGHLANWLNYQIDGYPPLPLWLKPIFFAIRNTNATKMLNNVNASGTMPTGAKTAPTSIPTADITDADGVQRYVCAVERWQAYTGEFVPSPLFGHQPRESWLRLHCVHAAHHLSFLVPKSLKTEN